MFKAQLDLRNRCCGEPFQQTQMYTAPCHMSNEFRLIIFKCVLQSDTGGSMHEITERNFQIYASED